VVGLVKRKHLDKNVIESIKQSYSKFGQLYPVLLDKNGVVIDGDHRTKALRKKVETFTLKRIEKKEDRLAVRLIANHARKGNDKTSWALDLTEFAKVLKNQGFSNIGQEISKITGLPYRTIMRYLPTQFKDLAQSRRASSPRSSTGVPLITSPLLPIGNQKGMPLVSVTKKIKEFEKISTESLPKIELKKFRNQSWKAIILRDKFFSEYIAVCNEAHVDPVETLQVALKDLINKLRKAK